MRNNAPWLANIKYLYYNPSVRKLVVIQHSHHLSRQRNALVPWLARRTNTMRRVLVLGAKFGRIDSDITISGDTLTLTNG